MQNIEQFFIPALLGIGLSAACGLRIFIPLLFLSCLSYFGKITLSPSFLWIGTMPALLTFAIAAILEVSAYYIPFIDNLLDSISIPGSVAAGGVMFASLFPDTEPLIKYSFALIAGGGIAGLTSAATSVTRLKSTALTGGIGNFVLATIESVGAIVVSLLSWLFPVLVILFILFFVWLFLKTVKKVSH